MAQYRVLERSFIGDRLVEAGEVVEYDGAPGRNLVAIDEPKKAKRTAPAASAPKSEDEAKPEGEAKTEDEGGELA